MARERAFAINTYSYTASHAGGRTASAISPARATPISS